MANTTTIQDIAKELNITAATVSRALNHHPRISEATRKAVEEAASRLNYTRNRIASSLRSGRTNLIGVIIPSAEINFFGSVIHGIENMANEHGYNILIYQSNEQPEYEKKGLQTFLSTQVDGIIASLAKETVDLSHYIDIKNKGIPLVFFDRYNEELKMPSVVIDDYKGAYEATEHLIKQGYKRIAHVAGPQYLNIFADRLNGYKAALKAHNIAYDESLVYQGDVSIQAGRDAVKKFLKMKKKPDAAFAVEDFTALGIMKELKENKIKIPAEFGIIGFANEGFDEHISPSLSSVDQQTIQMGKEAFKMMLDIITTKPGKKNIKTRVVLEPLMRFRESSQRKQLAK